MKQKYWLCGSLILMQLIMVSFSPPLIKQRGDPDRIVGKWITEKKNLIVQVYRSKNEYKAKVLWFNDKDDLSRPMNIRTDYHNPDPALRDRKLIGMEVLKKLTYNNGTDSWEKGTIYDAQHGKEWSSYAYLTDDGLLRVTGYWQFKFISKSMDFNRIK